MIYEDIVNNLNVSYQRLTIDQIVIATCGFCGIWFLSRRNAKLRRWGFITGLISQPFWIYATWTGKQLGMFILSIWYTYCIFDGFLKYFIMDPPKSNNKKVINLHNFSSEEK